MTTTISRIHAKARGLPRARPPINETLWKLKAERQRAGLSPRPFFFCTTNLLLLILVVIDLICEIRTQKSFVALAMLFYLPKALGHGPEISIKKPFGRHLKKLLAASLIFMRSYEF